MKRVFLPALLSFLLAISVTSPARADLQQFHQPHWAGPILFSLPGKLKKTDQEQFLNSMGIALQLLDSVPVSPNSSFNFFDWSSNQPILDKQLTILFQMESKFRTHKGLPKGTDHFLSLVSPPTKPDALEMVSFVAIDRLLMSQPDSDKVDNIVEVTLLLVDIISSFEKVLEDGSIENVPENADSDTHHVRIDFMQRFLKSPPPNQVMDADEKNLRARFQMALEQELETLAEDESLDEDDSSVDSDEAGVCGKLIN